MDGGKNLWVFCISMLLSLVFWRLIVILRKGEVSFLRGITSLTFHHYHYGILLVFIAALFLIFHSVNKYSVALTGLGFGSIFDSFISRLFSGSLRSTEITNYHGVFVPTIILFLILILISACFYLVFRENIKS